MLQKLKEKFGETRVNHCLTSATRINFLIAENATTNRSYIVPKTKMSIDVDKCLEITNPSAKEIHHLSIDACFLTQQQGYGGKKCDLAVFDNSKFCFVELKSNVKTKKNARQKLKDAQKQLGATIDYFDDNDLDFTTHTLEAYIVLKNKCYPIDQASRKARRKKFFDDYEVDLFEKSEIEF